MRLQKDLDDTKDILVCFFNYGLWLDIGVTTFFWSRSLTVTTDSVTVTVTVTILTVIIVTVSHGNFIKSLSSNTKLEKMCFTTTAIREEPKQIHMWIFWVFFWTKRKKKLIFFVYITFQRNFHKTRVSLNFRAELDILRHFLSSFCFARIRADRHIDFSRFYKYKRNKLSNVLSIFISSVSLIEVEAFVYFSSTVSQLWGPFVIIFYYSINLIWIFCRKLDNLL